MASTFREWPSSPESLSAARNFLVKCAQTQRHTLLLPDKDADGLSASLIIFRTLIALGLPEDHLHVHFVTKGSNVHSPAERARIEESVKAQNITRVVVVDQGSRAGPSIIDADIHEISEAGQGKTVETLLVDHHFSYDFPDGAIILTAAHHPPIATSSTLAYVLCRPLFPSEDIVAHVDYLCLIGTYGDLGSSFNFATLPNQTLNKDMSACLKRCGKKNLSDAVGLVNAPRRTAAYDVENAWKALKTSVTPKDVASFPRLCAARREVSEEVNRWSHVAPIFSGDGHIACIRINSQAQIHPMIAARWASTLRSSKLEVVMCVNTGYLPAEANENGVQMSNFSCRVAKCAKDRSPNGVNIIEILQEYAGRQDGLTEAMGDNFARGHKEASGGIVPSGQFERLWDIMRTSQVEEQSSKPFKKKRKLNDTPEKGQTSLDGWMGYKKS